MKKFIAVYYTPPELAAKSTNMSKEDMAKGMEAWFAWKEVCGDHIVDFGAPLMPGSVINQKEEWTSSQSTVNGYSIVQANDYEGAKKLFANHPHLSWGAGTSIELREFAQM